jgi:hypothetical protein
MEPGVLALVSITLAAAPTDRDREVQVLSLAPEHRCDADQATVFIEKAAARTLGNRHGCLDEDILPLSFLRSTDTRPSLSVS